MAASVTQLLQRIEDLENQLAESDQLIEAIRAGEVDAFAISSDDKADVYTLQSGDYAYRILIEEFGEGAVNVTEEGLIVYTNTYFFNLVKQPYEKVVGSSIFDLIHEESKEKFRTLFAESLRGKAKGEINLEAGGQTIPVYISFTSLQPKLPTVGIIVTDLTDSKKNEAVILKYQQDLEEKNNKLIQSNTELASFAYIASHDLQEPLRKIQTFTDRLIETEHARFSTHGRDYFQRILNASKRMQELISSLLNYSRLNTTTIAHESTDLNITLSEVKNDLKELIQEKHAVIHNSDLPTLHVIPHQFVQLFSNIILNAIKYQRPGVTPLIGICAEIVQHNKSRYWEISFTDNGIGFDQQYADRIFEMFQRLHGRMEYEGTGIGLAICKKIVQNHNGFIKATGRPGEGATFKIYLPVEN